MVKNVFEIADDVLDLLSKYECSYGVLRNAMMRVNEGLQLGADREVFRGGVKLTDFYKVLSANEGQAPSSSDP